MSEFRPLDRVAFAHLTNSSLAALAPAGPVALRTVAAGFVTRGADAVETFALLTARVG